MSTPRSTIKVSDLKEKVNRLLAKSASSREVRQGYIILLEAYLYETGNYQGYRFLRENEVPIGEKAGINYVHILPELGETEQSYEVRKVIETFAGTDNTRVFYN